MSVTYHMICVYFLYQTEFIMALTKLGWFFVKLLPL